MIERLKAYKSRIVNWFKNFEKGCAEETRRSDEWLKTRNNKPEIEKTDEASIEEREREIIGKNNYRNFRQRIVSIVRPTIAMSIAVPAYIIDINFKPEAFNGSQEAAQIINDGIDNTRYSLIGLGITYGVLGTTVIPSLVIRKNRRKINEEIARLHMTDNPNLIDKLNPYTEL